MRAGIIEDRLGRRFVSKNGLAGAYFNSRLVLTNTKKTDLRFTSKI